MVVVMVAVVVVVVVVAVVLGGNEGENLCLRQDAQGLRGLAANVVA